MMRTYRFYFITFIFVFVIVSMVTITVNATEDKRLQHNNEYYEELEEQYIEALRSSLEENGYRNAGITMTKVFYENGEREYTVRLHHRRMEKLSKAEQDALLENISQIAIEEFNSRIYLKFL